MKIGSRLSIGFLLIALLASAALIFFLAICQNVNREFKVLRTEIISGEIAIAEMSKATVEVIHETMAYVTHSRAENKQNARLGLEYLEKTAAQYLNSATDIGQEEQKAAEQLMVKIEEYVSVNSEIIRLKDQGVAADELLIKGEQTANVAMESILEQLGKRKVLYAERLAATGKMIGKMGILAVRLSLVAIILIVILSIVVAHVTTKSIVNPICDLNRGTEIIGMGELDYQIGTNSNDEVGQLSHAFDKMATGLKETTISVEELNKEVAERKKAEAKIRLQAEEWKKTFNSIADLIFIIDTEHRFVKTNEAFCKAVKMRPEDLVGKKCYELLHKTKEPHHDCPLTRTLEDKKAHAQEIFDPNIGMPLSIRISPLFDENGRIVGAIHIATDITKQKEAEEKLKETMEMKSQFLSMVSHELRTPLTAIKEGIALVSDGWAGDVNEEQEELLGISKRNVDRLARLINDVLDFQKFEVNKMKSKMKPNDINKIAKDVHQVMLTLTKDKNLNLILELEDNIPEIEFDSDQITQVLMNFVNNSIKFTEQGDVTITTSETDDEILVAVSDTGCGIKKEDISKVFNEFEQLSRKTSGKTGGTGLGLAISKKIIEQHSGKIWVESEFDKGTTFFFAIPKLGLQKVAALAIGEENYNEHQT
ncbi:MAG: PAS domain-containing protein [Planctomycetes bacterium]|nr:PAS domain-containing protein [Planctomycetota bacterium]